MVSRLARISPSADNKRFRRLALKRRRGDTIYSCHTRTSAQKLFQFTQLFVCAASQHFYTSVREINCMTCDANSACDITSTVAKEDTLDPAGHTV